MNPRPDPADRGPTAMHGRAEPQADALAPAEPRPPGPRRASQHVAEALLQAALAAHRDGALSEWWRRHRRIAAWLQRHALGPVVGTAGDLLRTGADPSLAVAWLLRWAIGTGAPDPLHAAGAAGLTRAQWLASPSWRPMLATLCHYGFEPVPAFRDRYHPQPGEAPASQLCGLWSVGPSTYYRYLDKGKRSAARWLRAASLDARQSLALRDEVRERCLARLADRSPEAVRAWHARQATERLAAGDAPGALWQAAQAGEPKTVADLLRRAAVELAGAPETDAVVDACAAAAASSAERFDLLLAHAGIWRVRGQPERELAVLEQALAVAAQRDDALRLGRVYGALGRYHEARDSDRAFACYLDCTDCLWRAGVGADAAPDGAAHAEVIEEYVVALVRLGWAHLLRNDPRARATLDRAEALRGHHALAPATLALLEQAWGEYWRRAGELPRAIEHKHRALNLYERLGDRGSVLKTCSNLSLVYGEARDFPRAAAYAEKVLVLADTLAVEPELIASAHLNLGAAHYWQGRGDEAARHYEQALAIARPARLHLLAGRAHYNIAEVAYLAFRQGGRPADEARGDLHAAAALAVWPHESDPAYAEATRHLKAEILGPDAARSADRLAPAEALLHPAELAEVQRQRERLAVPAAPDAQVEARLAIAEAYLAVAVKEREAALALVRRHGLAPSYAERFNALQTRFERDPAEDERLAQRWAGSTRDFLAPERCQAVLARLTSDGRIGKRAYGELCGVSPATASKHLTMLAGRGLVRQTGKGPSTRYLLAEPDAGAPGA